ncbi:Mur ligase [Schizopora paradoxa]|uniref:Mur ligase n=1 Tax=Schizopora paradoxa TaxID=27342 RepID=A0A0H2SHE0_9AGAM|nr:Mur ligase [Schizopora paradoxa]
MVMVVRGQRADELRDAHGTHSTSSHLTTAMSIDLTLDRIRILLSKFEKYTRPTIHVAGTNGKGSVCALLSSVFQACHPTPSVGRFNSPHLVDVTDSITINGKPISQSTFGAIYSEVKETNDRQRIGASNFEVLTVTALLIFERQQVDVVVCEVGMGGRLDATNVIPDEAIVASVITSIDLDHQAFLGSTVAAIAREKAGIIRRNKPVVVGQQKHAEVVGVVEEIAHSQGAFLTIAPCAKTRNWNEILDGARPPSFSLNPFSPPPPNPVSVEVLDSDPYDLLLPLHGEHQRNNLGVVVAVLKILSTISSVSRNPNNFLQAADASTMRRGIRECIWPGRLSFHTFKGLNANSPELPILADGAHNEAASQLLANYVSNLVQNPASENTERTTNLTFILALSHSPPKTPSSVIQPLLTVCDAFGTWRSRTRLSVRVAALRFTPPSGMPWVKSVPPSEIQKVVEDTAKASPDRKCTDYWTASDAEVDDARNDLAKALEWASQWSHDEDGRKLDHLVVIAGSLYLVADLYRLLDNHA